MSPISNNLKKMLLSWFVIKVKFAIFKHFPMCTVVAVSLSSLKGLDTISYLGLLFRVVI